MSAIAKGVKKVWKATTGKVLSKLNEVRKKVMKSKAFKIALVAATVYFGGAALLSLAGGGTAAAGLGSAWGGITGAGSAVAAGNFSGAASALATGFTGAGAAGASTAALTAAGEVGAGLGAQFGAGAAYTGGAIANNAAIAATATGAAAGGAASLPAGGFSPVDPLAGTKLAGTMPQATTAATSASAAAPQGLMPKAWGSLGGAGKAAVVTGGINMAGQMISGHAAEKAAEEERKRRTYWGVDGAGNTVDGQSNVGNLNYATPYPSNYTPPQQWQPKSLDDLINETRNRTTANSGLLWG